MCQQGSGGGHWFPVQGVFPLPFLGMKVRSDVWEWEWVCALTGWHGVHARQVLQRGIELAMSTTMLTGSVQTN